MVGFVFYVVEQLLNLYAMIIVVWALLSWFPGASQSRLGNLLNRIVVPYIRLFNFIPPLGGISFSPLVALLVVYLAQHGVSYLYMLVI